MSGTADGHTRPRSSPVAASRLQPTSILRLSALSSSPALSFNGRFIAFESSAGLVDGDDNDVSDVYRYDRVRRVLVRASLDSEGRETAVDGSFDPAVSATGRFVAFSSAASDLLVGDTNLVSTDRNLGNTRFPEDIFVKDVRTGAITRASLDEDGIELDGTSFSPSLSADGRLITFVTDDSGLIEPDPDNDLQGDSSGRDRSWFPIASTARDFRRPGRSREHPAEFRAKPGRRHCRTDGVANYTFGLRAPKPDRAARRPRLVQGLSVRGSHLHDRSGGCRDRAGHARRSSDSGVPGHFRRGESRTMPTMTEASRTTPGLPTRHRQKALSTSRRRAFKVRQALIGCWCGRAKRHRRPRRRASVPASPKSMCGGASRWVAHRS